MKILLFDSLRAKLTLWYVGVLALVLVVFSLMVYTLLSRALHQRVDTDLRGLIEVAFKSLINDEAEGQSSESAARSTVAELFNGQQTLAIFDGAGNLLAENSLDDDFQPQLPHIDPIFDNEINFDTVAEDDGDDSHRLASQRALVPPSNTPYIVLASQPLESIEEEMESLREIFYLVVPSVLVMAGLGGWFLARKSLDPMVVMSEHAHTIGAGNLDQRLPVANPRDELGQLAQTFNQLLERLGEAFAQQRRFMTDASHELRTPLSVMHTTADVTLQQDHRDESEYRDALRVVGEQTRRLTRIVEDMFTLARADAGRYQLLKSKFYLDELIDETARAATILASGKGISVDVSNLPESPFYGDEDLLRQMILNLLDNAIKHTPSGGLIRLSMTSQPQKYLIEVSDSGPGIPVEARPHIFERFFRADKSRSRSDKGRGGGAGLGLAIALWIAEAHQGSLELGVSDKGGATFLAKLPFISDK